MGVLAEAELESSSMGVNGPRAPASFSKILIAALVIVGLVAGFFGWTMVERFRGGTAFFATAEVEVWAADERLGSFPESVTGRMVIEVAPGHRARVRMNLPGEGFTYAYALYGPLETDEGVASQLGIAQVGPQPTPLVGAAPGALAGLDAPRGWVELPADVLGRWPDGVRVLVVFAKETLPEEVLRTWEHRLPGLQGRPPRSIAWSRVDIRVDAAWAAKEDKR